MSCDLRRRLYAARVNSRLVVVMPPCIRQGRKLIPAGNLCEVRFDDLDKDPVNEVGADNR